MVAMQFSIIASFEVLVECIYVILFQENLIENSHSDAYLVQSFFATALQYNCFALTLWWLFHKQRWVDPGTEWLGEREKKFASSFVIAAGILSIYTITTEGGVQFTYGNAAVGESLEGEAGSWGPVAVITQLGTIYAVFCLVRGIKGNWWWRIAYILSSLLVGLFALKILTGARAAIFVLVMYFLSVSVLLKRNIRKYVFLGGIAGSIVLSIFSSFSNVRITGVTLDMGDAFELLSSGISAQLSQAKYTETVNRSLRDFAWRSAGARMGAILFADVDQRGLVGMGAVVNNIFSIVPRAIWPERPYGNSVDGTASGLATYQVSQILLGSTDTNNQSDSVSSASVAYWTLGWAGVIVSGAFSAWVFWFVTSRAGRQRYALPWLFLLGLTWGGWYVIADIGTWLNQLSRYGSIMLVVAIFLGLTKFRFISA